MNQVEIYPIDPSYVKDTGLSVTNIEAVENLVPFEIKERSLVYLPAGQIGGNHSHPRTEAFIPLGNIALHWIDESGEANVVEASADGEKQLWVVNSRVPHAVINLSENAAFLIEFATGPQLPEDVTPVQVIQ